jgi:hypothetical protein
LLRAVNSVLPHEVDHIRAKKHRGSHSLENTCYACAYCNSAKGSDVASYDDETGELLPLFNPRSDDWSNHFYWQGPLLIGKTATGRATISLLRINAVARIEHRRLLMEAGTY